MIYGMYSLRDVKSTWLTPTTEPNDEYAIRNFVFATEGMPLLKLCPNDYALYRIGDFDIETGSLLSYPTPELLIDGVEAYRQLSLLRKKVSNEIPDAV